MKAAGEPPPRRRNSTQGNSPVVLSTAAVPSAASAVHGRYRRYRWRCPNVAEMEPAGDEGQDEMRKQWLFVMLENQIFYSFSKSDLDCDQTQIGRVLTDHRGTCEVQQLASESLSNWY